MAIAHLLFAVLGAMSLAVAYYVPGVMAHPKRELLLRRNAGLMFLQSVIPAIPAGWLAVALINQSQPKTTGDFRFEFAAAFAAGTSASALIKKYSKLLPGITPEPKPEGNP